MESDDTFPTICIKKKLYITHYLGIWKHYSNHMFYNWINGDTKTRAEYFRALQNSVSHQRFQ